MLHNIVSVAVSYRPLLNLRPKCLALASNNVNTDQLRSQLDQLHDEAEKTRAKANQHRARLLRLSEAVEKLQRQAAISVHAGKENDARELLFQKKKVMQALETSKSRIEALDKLSEKLTEAISVRESQLVGNVTEDLEVGTEVAPTQVHIVPPKREVREEKIENGVDAHILHEDFSASAEHEADLSVNKKPNDLRGDPGMSNQHDSNNSSILKEFSSYEDFLEHIDQQLCKIETKLLNVLNVSSLLLDCEEKEKNMRLKQTMELLDSIHSIRERIASTVTSKVEIR